MRCVSQCASIVFDIIVFKTDIQYRSTEIFLSNLHEIPYSASHIHIHIHMIGGVIGALTPGGEPVEIEARASIGR